MRRSIPAVTLAFILLFFALAVGMPGQALADAYTYTGLGGGGAPLSVASNGSSVFAGMENGHVWRNTGGTDWIDAGGLDGGTVNALVWDGATIYAGTSNGQVYYYISDGTWGWAGYGAGYGNSVTCLVATGTPGYLYAGSSNRRVYWKNGSSSWLDTATDMGSTVLELTQSSSYVYASTANGLVYRYNNNPSSPAWTSLGYCGTSDAHVVWNDSLGLYALGYNSHAWNYNGSSWTDTGLVGFWPIYAVARIGSTIYAGNGYGQVWSFSGSSWSNTSAPFSGTAARIQDLAAGGSNLFAACLNGHVCEYSSGTWTDLWPTARAQVNALLSSGGIYAGCDNGQVYGYGSGWSPAGNNIGSPVLSLGATTARMYAGCDDGNVYWNNSGTWTSTSGPGRAFSLAFNGSTLYAGCADGHVWYYNEGSATWTDELNLASGAVNSLAWSGTNLSAGTENGYVFIKEGGTWSMGTLLDGTAINALAWNGANLCAGTNSGHVYSYDGATWSNIFPSGFWAVHSMATSGGTVFAGVNNGQVLRYMGGTTWNTSGSVGSSPVEALAWTGTYMWTGSDAGSYRGTLTMPPTATTDAATSITSAGATLNGNITGTGGENADRRGFRYRKAGAGSWTDWTEAGSFGTGAVSHVVTGLDPATDYEYQACARNSVGWGYGSTVTFRTAVPVSAWYLAEGSTAWGFSTYIAIENPNTSAVQARITYMDTAAGNTSGNAAGKGVVKTRTLTLPASSQTVVNAADDLPYPTDFSTRVESLSGRPLAVDRTMTFYCYPSDETYFGAHNSIAASAPSTTWYLPEGSSAWGFSTWTLVQNPNAKDATVKLTYMTEAGPASFDKSVPAYSRATFNMADDIGAQDASTRVSSSVPVVAERSMYSSAGSAGRREGHCSVGATSPADDFYLAEGTTAWGFETYVLVQNPGDAEATVSLTYMTPQGPIAQPDFKIPAGSRRTVKANDQLPYQTDISTLVHSDKPIVAERAMYWSAAAMPGRGMTDSIGVDSPHMFWFLPSGGDTGGNGAETYTLVQNPNPGAVTVLVTYMTPNGTGNVTFEDEIPANSRKTYTMSDRIKGSAAIMVLSKDLARPIIVERSMYFADRVAGTDTIGAFADPNPI